MKRDKKRFKPFTGIHWVQGCVSPLILTFTGVSLRGLPQSLHKNYTVQIFHDHVQQASYNTHISMQQRDVERSITIMFTNRSCLKHTVYLSLLQLNQIKTFYFTSPIRLSSPCPFQRWVHVAFFSIVNGLGWKLGWTDWTRFSFGLILYSYLHWRRETSMPIPVSIQLLVTKSGSVCKPSCSVSFSEVCIGAVEGENIWIIRSHRRNSLAMFKPSNVLPIAGLWHSHFFGQRLDIRT